MRTAIYPGTFDPITFGHIDVIRKSLKIVDKVVVATTDNVTKDYFFSIEERISLIEGDVSKTDHIKLISLVKRMMMKET